MSTAGAAESTTSKSLAVTSLTIPGGGSSDLETSMSSTADADAEEAMDSITPLSVVEDEVDTSTKTKHRTMVSNSAVGPMLPGMTEFLASRSEMDVAGDSKPEPATAAREEERKSEISDDSSGFKRRKRAHSAKDLRGFINDSASSARLANPWGIVTEPDATAVLVRGPTYPTDKVKIKSKARLCPLVGVECWKSSTRIDHIVQSEWSTWYSENIDPLDDSVFVIIMHLQVESIGACFIHYHILEGGLPARTECQEFNDLFNQLVRSADYPGPEVTGKSAGSSSSLSDSTASTSAGGTATAAAAVSSSTSSSESTTIKWSGVEEMKKQVTHEWPSEAEREKYDQECDEWRRSRLKLIPKLVKGPFLVKRMVQNTPCILGRAVAHRYFRGSNYLEIDAQVDESYVSASIIKMCHSYSTSIVVDMYWTIEGLVSYNELPERIMMGCTIHKLDFSKTTDMTLKADKKEHKKRHGGTSRDFSRDALRLEP